MADNAGMVVYYVMKGIIADFSALIYDRNNVGYLSVCFLLKHFWLY